MCTGEKAMHVGVKASYLHKVLMKLWND